MRARTVTREEMYAIEKAAITGCGIPALLLMENAGRLVADEAERLAGPGDGPVVVVAGKGNNGGDGFVAARHLHARRFKVRVYLASREPDESKPSFTNLGILVTMGLDVRGIEGMAAFGEDIARAALVIDALYGIGISGALGARERKIIETLNARARKILSVDIPSGLDADTGKPMPVAVRATRTITFGFMKHGCSLKKGKTYAGNINVVDIGFPPESYS
jgi:hydroxyethylthiazole kinase-like uncharacterized protein yjeF